MKVSTHRPTARIAGARLRLVNAPRQSLVRAYVRACHPGPTATVTFVITAVTIGAGRDRVGVLLVAAAVLLGQLSVGWSNDARDADRDLSSGRSEKPTVRGDITASLLWRSAFLALAASIALSYVAGGLIGGTAHVLAVLSAWAYNLALKTTRWSAVPFAVSFGLVPTFITYGLTPAAPAAAWVSVTWALMGVGAHLANALPDIDSDRTVSAGGVAAAMGRRTTTWVALLCMVSAVTILATHLGTTGPLAAVIVAVAAAGAITVARLGRERALFGFVQILAVCAVLMLVTSAAQITR